MSFDARAAIDGLLSALRDAGTPERAAGQKRYLKSDLEHYGTTLGAIRKEVRTIAHSDLSHEQLVGLVRALWSQPIFDSRIAAVLVLESYPRLLGAADLGLIQELVRGSGTWALVDPLAANVLGGILIEHPAVASRLDRWARDSDFWVRRAALLSQMGPIKRGASFERFARYADAMLDEREFFIRKAIGWVLRETSKRDPDTVYSWLAPRIDRASGVTVREAVKYLDSDRRARLMVAYQKRRGRPLGAPARTRR
jgi:3-methyladenine DNA glycosylase AlkD